MTAHDLYALPPSSPLSVQFRDASSSNFNSRFLGSSPYSLERVAKACGVESVSIQQLEKGFSSDFHATKVITIELSEISDEGRARKVAMTDIG